jgi:serine/threonine protein kinase
MPVTLEQFVHNLTASGLMSAEQVAAIQQTLPADKRPQNAEELGKFLVHLGNLTAYQAGAVWQGRIKGLVFDEYIVLDKLDEGGMGVVLKAWHRHMERLVAVKTLPAAVMKSPDAVQRFYHEVKAAARLSHPNIVAAYDAREHEGSHYLVMEYVEGKDLAALIREHGPLPVPQAVDCILQAARGLDYAHKQGIIHRDIKPSNLLVDRSGTVKVLDMGLARIQLGAGAVDPSRDDRLTARQPFPRCAPRGPTWRTSWMRFSGRCWPSARKTATSR